MKTRHLIILLSLATILVGCAPSKPSEAEARKVMEQLVGESNGLITLQSFSKTNAVQMGDNAYALEYSATLKFQEDCEYGGGFRPMFAASKGIRPPWNNPWPSAEMPRNSGHKGQTTTRQGKIFYQKTENGWRFVNIQDGE